MSEGPMQNSKNPFSHHKMPLNMRFYISLMRLAFKVLGQASPSLTGKLALRLFMTPPQFSVPRREQSVLDSAELSYHTINGYKIAIHSWGEGPIVLLSHGWGGRGTQFFAFIEPLVAAGYRVVAFDAPAHGNSSGKRTNMLDVCGVVASVAENVGPVKALIGHSFGAGTALLASDRLGLAAEKVILISCVADVLWVVEKFSEVFAMNSKVSAAMKQEALRRYSNAYGKPWQWPHLSPKHTIKSVTGDILIMHDQQDHEVPCDHALQLKQAAPNADLLITNRLGHRKILMNKDCVKKCIDFLTKSKPTEDRSSLSESTGSVRARSLSALGERSEGKPF